MLDNEPELFPHLNSIWQAFITLDRSRQYGYGHPQPLLFSEMSAFAEARKMTGDRFNEMIEYLQAMDQIYLEHHTKKAENESRKAKAKASGRT